MQIRLSTPSLLGLWALLVAAHTLNARAEAEAYSGNASALELPEISAIVDMQAMSTDAAGNPDDGKLRIKHAELGFQGYLNPSIRGDLIIGLEQEYGLDDSVETEVHIEEAYVSFLDLPGQLDAKVGRTLVGFGRLNAIHPHHWAFADTPLALANLYGEHPWMDDGALISWLVPNPLELYIKLTGGVLNGNAVGHDHADDNGDEHADEHDDDHAVEPDDDHDNEDHASEHGHSETVEWDGQVLLGRLFADLPMSETLGAQLGYSIVADEGDSRLQGLDLVFDLRQPNSYRRMKWHTELFSLQDSEHDTDPMGLFSYVQVGLSKAWEVGARYDWTELLSDDDETEWAGTGFGTYYITHTTYARAQYQYREHADGEGENIVTAQLVWGIGPHSHRLQD